MKKLFTLILVILSFTAYSQNIGDSYNDIHEKVDSSLIKEYITFTGYYQIMIEDSIKEIFVTLDFIRDTVYGISYVYKDLEVTKKEVPKFTKGSYNIANNMYVKDKNLIYILRNAILIYDIEYINRKSEFWLNQ